MPALDESHDERILRILRDAKKCLTAQEVTDEIHKELGSDGIYIVSWVGERLSQLANSKTVQKDGDKYCYQSATQK
jgi:repressor of nif and glnA expression